MTVEFSTLGPVEDSGIEPGSDLRRLHRQIQTADTATVEAGPVPRQLPAPPSSFIGRAGELSQLGTALPASGDPPSTMAIWAINGTGGVGKTWLALRWAHDHAQSFP